MPSRIFFFLTALVIIILKFTAVGICSPEPSNTNGEETGYTVQHKDNNSIVIEGVIDVDPSSQINGKEALLQGRWGYMGDEHHESFPNIYISTIKKSASVSTNNQSSSQDRKRRSLSSRGSLQSQYTRHRVSENITPIIMKYAREYDLNPHIIRAIIEIESSYNPSALSCSGACGLMQLKPGTAYDMGVRDYWNPEQNIKAGSKYIRLMLDKFGDLDTALAAYNQGPGTVQRAGSKIPNATAKRYVQKFYNALGK